MPSPVPTRRPRAGAVLVLAAVAACAAALLAACGGGSASGTGTTSPAASRANANGANRVTGGGGPAASGRIAEIDGNTLQVQSTDSGQVAVQVGDKTTYTQTKATTLAAVKVGTCIVATSAQNAASSSATPPTSIIAADVIVMSATNGSCTRNFAGGGPRGSFTGVPSGFTRPSGAPSGSRPSGSAVARPFATTGLVTEVHGDTISVKSERRDFASGSTPSAAPSTTTTTVTVTVDGSTKYTETVSATKAALQVGLCLTASGTTGSDGTVSATRVSLSPATSAGCTASFRGGFGGFGRPGGPRATVTSGG